MLDILLDAGLDSVKMLPFLYLAYLLIEWIERTRGSRIEALLAEGSRWGAAVGALLGTIPQCGFSAMAASLYGSGVITLGTLMAVFIATSDEAIPMLLAVPERWPELAMLILIKLCIALAVGLLLDLVVTRLLPAPLRGGFTGKAAAVDCPPAMLVARASKQALASNQVESASPIPATSKRTGALAIIAVSITTISGFFG